MKKKVKIMQMVHCMDIAGTEKVVYSIVRNLNKENFSFSICCLDFIGELGGRLIKEGVEVISLDRTPGIDFSLIKKLIRILKDQQVDILHAHQYTPYFYGATAAIFSGRSKVIFTEHGRHQPDRVRPRRVIYNKFLNLFTNRITGVSNFSKDSLVRFERLPAKKIDVIYNGINPKDFEVDMDREAKTNELGIKREELVIGMIAGLRPVKNHSLLLQAFKEVVKKVPRAKLLLIGDGPLKESLESKVKSLRLENNVVFLGFRRDIAELLQVMDIFVLSSVAEATSLTLLEAMARGLPVVAVDAGGNSEIVLKGQTGILVPPKNYIEFAKAIISLIADPEKRRRMGEAGKRRAKSLFGIDRMLREYENLYLSLDKFK